MKHTMMFGMAISLMVAGCDMAEDKPESEGQTTEDLSNGVTYGPIGEKQGPLPPNAQTTFVWQNCYYDNELASPERDAAYVNITWPTIQTYAAASVRTLISQRSDYQWQYLQCYNSNPTMSMAELICAPNVPASQCTV